MRLEAEDTDDDEEEEDEELEPLEYPMCREDDNELEGL